MCQTVHGGALDRAISHLVIEALTPLAVEVALTVQQELASRHEDADRLRRQHVGRAHHEADLAQPTPTASGACSAVIRRAPPRSRPIGDLRPPQSDRFQVLKNRALAACATARDLPLRQAERIKP